MIQEPTRIRRAEQAVQSFVAACLATEVAECRRQLDLCWSEDGQFVHPEVVCRGRDALALTMPSTTHTWPPDVRIDTGELAEHHGWFRFTWNIVEPDGRSFARGLDVAELDVDGRMQCLITFLGPTPEPR